MADLNEKIGFIRGLISSMNLEPETTNAKLLAGFTEALEEIAEGIAVISDDLSELNDFVESIDEDLEDLESMHDEDDGDLEFLDDLDEFGESEMEPSLPEEGLRVLRSKKNADPIEVEETLAGGICPECGKLFFVRLEVEEDPDAMYLCPHCDKEVSLHPLGPDNAPIAKKVDP